MKSTFFCFAIISSLLMASIMCHAQDILLLQQHYDFRSTHKSEIILLFSDSSALQNFCKLEEFNWARKAKMVEVHIRDSVFNDIDSLICKFTKLDPMEHKPWIPTSELNVFRISYINHSISVQDRIFGVDSKSYYYNLKMLNESLKQKDSIGKLDLLMIENLLTYALTH